MADFDPAVTKTLIREGGATYTHDPDDPGGETKFGISKRAFPKENIRQLTEERARALYRQHYWDRIKGDQIESQIVAENLFDTAVNMGVITAVKIVQVALDVTVDGIIGPKTLAAINSMDSKELIPRLALAKIARYADLCNKNPRLKKYLLGWINRTLGASA